MTKTQSITLGSAAFFAVLSAWQFMQIQSLKESHRALLQQVKLTSRETQPIVTVPGGGGKRQPAREPERKEEAPQVAQRAEDPERAARDAQWQQMRQVDRSQRHAARVLALTTKLNLSPEQQASVLAALQKGSAERDALREAGDARRRSGTPETDEMRRADMAKVAAVDLQQESNIAALLSADQASEYTNYKAEQKQVGVENRANQLLGDLQNRFSLSEDQKEAAFQYFAKQEQESGFDPAQVVAQGGDPMELMQQMQKDRLAALQQILTPEQFTLHSEQEAQRAEMFQNFRPGGITRTPSAP